MAKHLLQPKGSCVEGVVLSYWHEWEVMDTLGGRAHLEEAGHWGVPLKGIWDPGPTHLLPPRHDDLLCHRPKMTGPSKHGLKS